MKGLRVNNGYLQLRISHKGSVYYKNFGKDSPEARELALMHYGEKKREILMGRFGITKEVPEKRFKDVVPLHLTVWEAQKDGDGKPAHDTKAIYERRRMFAKSLIPYFGNKFFHLITTVDVEKWRAQRLADGLLGTSVNREMVPLGSIFSDVAQDIALERYAAFKIPSENPVKYATKAKMRKRERLLSDYELKKIKLACKTLNDQDTWAVCQLALKSVLSEKDLRKLDIGAVISLERSKTGVPVHIPITVLERLNWHNWRSRWKAVRREAGLMDVQFRDLRKCGGNYLIGKHDTKLVSQYFGHASVRTTEQSYVLTQQEKMKPLSEDLEAWVNGI